MAVKLKRALSETYSDWHDTLPSTWRNGVLTAKTLGSGDLNANIELQPWTPIFPVIHKPLPLGSPKKAHTFRAFQGISPKKVRVVVVGQDPYPDVGKATGRAFEQGDLFDWSRDATRVSPSLKAIVQNAAAAATNRPSYRKAGAGWDSVVGDIESKRLNVPKPTEIFDFWQQQGVLWLNTTFSISLFRSTPSHQKQHFKFWQPFLNRVLEHIVAERGAETAVFALWGGWAKGFGPRVRRFARAAGNLPKIRFAEQYHPVWKTFLTGSNTFSDINTALNDLGETPIDWLP